jgi:hypothetical protein
MLRLKIKRGAASTRHQNHNTGIIYTKYIINPLLREPLNGFCPGTGINTLKTLTNIEVRNLLANLGKEIGQSRLFAIQEYYLIFLKYQVVILIISNIRIKYNIYFDIEYFRQILHNIMKRVKGMQTSKTERNPG